MEQATQPGPEGNAVPEFLVEDRGPQRWVMVDRYQRRNAWTFSMGRRLASVLSQTQTDRSIRALAIAGRHGCFSSGVDRGELKGGVVASPFPVEEFLRFAKPTLACVDGLAFGMGTTLAL